MNMRSAESPTWPSPSGPALPPPPVSGPPPRGQERGGGRGGAVLVAAALVVAVTAAVLTVAVGTSELGDGIDFRAEQRAEPAADEELEAAPGNDTDPLPTDSSVADVAEAVLPSVARVDVAGSQGPGAGSAVVYRDDGHLITNAHVVADAATVQVTFADGQRVEADVVGTDTDSDVAVLVAEDADGLVPPAFAEGGPRPGEAAIAIGSPFGLDSTVTSGIVSATERFVPTPEAPLVGMLQTDAAINPGNSGGALVNAQAELIGINTAILSRTGQSGGIGFAIPIATVVTVADQLIDQGFVRYAQLGVLGENLSPRGAERLGLDAAAGALITQVVEGSAADEAGIETGDLITAVDDTEIGAYEDLIAAVRRYEPGDTVTVSFLRDGSEGDVEVVLAERGDG